MAATKRPPRMRRTTTPPAESSRGTPARVVRRQTAPVDDRRRMPRDREIVALALPALGALAAEPLYVLGDTAVVGHLGTVPLAGLALAGLLLGQILAFCT